MMIPPTAAAVAETKRIRGEHQVTTGPPLSPPRKVDREWAKHEAICGWRPVHQTEAGVKGRRAMQASSFRRSTAAHDQRYVAPISAASGAMQGQGAIGTAAKKAGSYKRKGDHCYSSRQSLTVREAYPSQRLDDDGDKLGGKRALRACSRPGPWGTHRETSRH